MHNSIDLAVRKFVDYPDKVRLNHLMAQLADGNRETFDEVYGLLWPVLKKFVLRFLGDDDLAEDIAQQSLMKVFYRAHTYDSKRDCLSWSMAIAANESKSYLRKATSMKDRHVSMEKVKDVTSIQATPEQVIIDDNLIQAIMDTLQTLNQREVDTILTAVHDLQRPTISSAAFRKRLQRAYQNLRSAWRDRHELLS